jgi:hypothetical protein
MSNLIYINEKGFVLPLGLMFLAIITILGTTAVILTTTDLKIGSNYKRSVQAFYDADAGIQYAIGSIENGLDGGTFPLPATIGNSVSFTSYYATPTGFSFVISNISMTDSNTYAFNSTGSGQENSQAVIEALFKRKSAINYAAFGDQKTDTKNSGITLSYNSSDPGASSTHEADVASNDWLVTHNGAIIDGKGVFGEQSDGSPTVDGIHGGTVFNGTPSVINEGRIDPDPLGINSGGVYDPSTYNASTSNDNDLSPDVAGTTTINTSGSITLYGKSGGANYYFTDIKLKNGANLTIDASAGPVNIFLEGGLDTHNSATINVIDSLGNPGKPTDFTIFSNSTAKIDFKHNSEFKGLVYAPFADVDMKNSSSVYGAIWSKTVDIKNSGTLYYDTALKDKYPTNDLSLLSWREVL